MIVPVNRSRTALTALSMISVLALGACSGDDPEPKVADPSPSATLPSSPSTTPVSGPVEPTMPPEAQGSDAAAAEAFVKFYWEMVNYAEQTEDLTGLKRIAAPECVACKRGMDYLTGVFDAGGQISGGIQTVSGAETTFGKNDGVQEATVRFELTSTRQRVNYPEPVKDKTFEAGTLRLVAVLAKADEGGWRMAYWGER